MLRIVFIGIAAFLGLFASLFGVLYVKARTQGPTAGTMATATLCGFSLLGTNRNGERHYFVLIFRTDKVIADGECTIFGIGLHPWNSFYFID